MTDLLTEEQAAKRLLMSLNSLRAIRKRGAIRYVAITARKIAYRPEDCEAYVQSQLRIEQAPPVAQPKGRRRSVSGQQLSGTVVPFSQRKKG